MRWSDLEDAILYGREVFEEAFNWDSYHIEVYITYFRRISYFKNNTATPYIVIGWNGHGGSEDSLLDTLWHELAHAFVDSEFDSLSKRKRDRFTKVFGPITQQAGIYDYMCTKKYFDEEKYVSAYATVSPEEDFAETVAAYLSEDYIVPTPRRVKEKLNFVKHLRNR